MKLGRRIAAEWASVGKGIGGWFRKLGGIKSALFVSLQDVQHANAGLGKIGQGMDANVVMSPIQFIQRTFTQSVAVVAERDTSKTARKWTIIDDHPVEQLLADPNPFYDGDTLTKAFLLSWFIDGNAYLLKLRNGLQGVVQLWYVPHWLIEPKWPRIGSTGREFITHYDYNPDGTGNQRVHVDNVVHLRVGLDPRNPRKGLSPIKAALREVLTDEEAATFSAYILGNMGVPGGVISPKSGDFPMDKEDVKEMKEYMTTGFTGKKRGNWLALGQPTEVKHFAFDPNRLMLGPLRDISEERICAMLGVPAAVVGFGAGLQSTKVGATMRELVKLAKVNCIEPTQVTIGRQLGRQLLVDFEPDPKRFRVVYDNSEVSMFLEEEDAVAKRSGALYTDGVATRNEARSMVGLEDVEDGDTFATKAAPLAAPADGDDGEGGEGGDEGAGDGDGGDEGNLPDNRLRGWTAWGAPQNGDDPS